jgi:type IV secretory pathway VirB10-like protein
MNKPTGNLFLKQLLADISSHANQGRLTVITEGKKHKKIVKEANPVPPKDEEEKPEDDQVTGAQAPNGAAPVPAPAAPADADKGAADLGPEKVPATSQEKPAGEDAEQAQADAAASKAELEKAKAEKDQAEKEIKKQSYVHLVSPYGVFFLLGKLVDHAFKTNTIDSLAAEMVQKLKITNQEDFSNFSEEMIPYKSIPGVTELLASIKAMAASQPSPQPDTTNSDE